MSGILDVIAQALMPSSNPMPAVRPHPGDVADVSALQLAPDMASAFANDVARYGKQAVTGNVSSNEMLNRPDLQGDAATLSDMLGEGVGAVMNYGGLLDGPTVTDIVGGAVDAYQGVKPGLVDAFGEPNVNRAEGAGLLASMMLPSKVRNSVGDMGFYSQAVRASEGLQRKQGNADGFFNDLTGKGQVKPDELNAMGFKKHFAGRSDIPRQEVQQFINENQVQIKETLLSNAEGYRRGTKFGDYTLEGGDNYRELLLRDNSSAGLLDELNSLNGQIGDAKVALRNDQSALLNVAEDMQREADKFIGGDNTKENYDNYQRVNRELSDFQDGKPLSDEAAGKYIYGAKELIERRDELARQKANLPEPFINSSHFDEPNILAHLRMKDRVDADGNKTLLIEEAQSDWHQKGGEYGYQTPELKRQLDDVNTELQAAKFKYSEYDDQKMLEELGFDELFSSDPMKPDFVEQSLLATRIDELGNMQANLESKLRDALPDAPFKTDDKSSWYNLAMKRGLLEAVEGGYDKMAITTGRQQADRYDLSKQINEVRLGPGAGVYRNDTRVPTYTVSAFDKNDNPVIMQSIESLDELPNLIGKDAAKSLVDQPFTDTPTGAARILAGQDLSVGGEGMKQFYDRTLPNTLGKLVKQDGQKVGTSFLPRKLQHMDGEFNYEGYSVDEVSDIRNLLAGRNDPMVNHTPEQAQRLENLLAREIPEGDTVHSIDITPEMRERVKKGLPLFATGGAAIGLAEMMSQQPQEDQRPGLFNSLQY